MPKSPALQGKRSEWTYPPSKHQAQCNNHKCEIPAKPLFSLPPPPLYIVKSCKRCIPRLTGNVNWVKMRWKPLVCPGYSPMGERGLQMTGALLSLKNFLPSRSSSRSEFPVIILGVGMDNFLNHLINDSLILTINDNPWIFPGTAQCHSKHLSRELNIREPVTDLRVSPYLSKI